MITAKILLNLRQIRPQMAAPAVILRLFIRFFSSQKTVDLFFDFLRF